MKMEHLQRTFSRYKGRNGEQGREALSESAGLWLQYTLDKDDQALFDEQVKVIQNNFYIRIASLYGKSLKREKCSQLQMLL